MKKAFYFICLIAWAMIRNHVQAACASCGGFVGGGTGVGPSFRASLGTLQFGQSAGSLSFSSSTPDPVLFTPIALHFDAVSRPDIQVITTNVVTTTFVTNVELDAVSCATMIYYTNSLGTIFTNPIYSFNDVLMTNISPVLTTNAVIRQVISPQILADVPSPPTNNAGYVINFYYSTNIVGTNADGTDQLSGSPFITWLITNSNPTVSFQLQISEFGLNPAYGLMKQKTYNYVTNTGSWSIQSLGGIVETCVTTNLDAATYETINTVQNSSGAVVQESANIYKITSWSTCTTAVLVSNIIGAGASAQVTTYTYYDPVTFDLGTRTVPQTVTHPNGSVDYYASYNADGNPTDVYSTYEDSVNGQETTYVYTPGAAGVSGSGDDGTLYPYVPRRTIHYVQGTEVSRSYTVFPSVRVRLDVRCTTPGQDWDALGNLITTNIFYTNGPNQFELQAVLLPDGTMSTYNYATNALYRTNITVTGQPDVTHTYVVDGVSNVVVLNVAGYQVSAASYDVISGLALSSDIDGNFDSYGRPQQVTHLDGATEYAQYSCCGLDSTVDRDGVVTAYMYDLDKREYGSEKFYGNTNLPITFEDNLDAAGRSVQSLRIGTNGSTMLLSQSAYDLAGELIAQTNALGGVTVYARTNDSTTGGLIRTIINPNGGVTTNLDYADGTLKATIGTAVHGVRYVYGTGSDANGNTCTYAEQIKLNGDGTDSAETTTTYRDGAGRITEILYADGSSSQSFYNAQGQLSKEVDPDGVTTLSEYNAKGELAYTAVAMTPGETAPDFSGMDRITQTTNDIIYDSIHSATVHRNRKYVWLDGQSTGTLIFSAETSADGLNSWQIQYRDINTAVTSHNQTVPGISRTATTTMPDGSYTVNGYSYGRLATSTRYNSSGTQIEGTTYGYDAQGRQNTTIDARNGATTLGYDDADLVATQTTPSPGGGSHEITTTTYDGMLQATNVTQPDGTTVNSIYLLTGELGAQSGSRTYPVGYSYDYAGRMKTMTNWSNFNGGTGARVTTWNYDGQRGWLTNKAYADGHGPGYAYTPAGRLAGRVWVRGVTTSYAYDLAGSQTNVSYSDGTPGIGYVYDRLGRQTGVLQAGMTDAMTYDLASDLLGEAFSGGLLSGLTVTNRYDAFLRRTNLSALNSSTVLASTGYGYDNASRLATVTDGTQSASYSYLANSPLVSQIVFKNGGTARMTTTKQYDYLNRLTQISSAPSSGLAATFNYNYNPANQRTKDTLTDGSYWVYGYDSLGQVTNACKFFSDGTPVAGQQFDYAFDTIGNRTQTQGGGDTNGANLRVANYSANNLNQITSRDVPGDVDVMGASILTNTVTVNGQTAYRKQEYFRQQVPVNNSSSALWTNITVSGGQSVTGSVYVAQTPEEFQYDTDGNLTNDGRWSYVWDGENRLVQMTNNTGVGPRYGLVFVYDAKGRRIQKVVATNGVSISTNKFLYDGWNLVAEMQPNNTLMRSYMWGSDLSGSMQGAGGVGGLLEISYDGLVTTNCFPAYDGNGNVMALINAADGTMDASYDYGPFGELIRATGPMAKLNPFRFSTEYQDDETDLIMYPYRPYNASTGRWLSRDPVDEPGFALLKQLEDSISSAAVEMEQYDLDDFDDSGQLKSSYAYTSPNEMAILDNNLIANYDPLGLQAAQKPPGNPQQPKPPQQPPPKPPPYQVKSVKITFYCNCVKCTGKNPGDKGYGVTSAGTTACKGTVAADWKKFPKGSQISFTMPDGSTFTGTVLDKGGGVKGNHLDIWCAAHQDAINNGTFTVTVTVTPP